MIFPTKIDMKFRLTLETDIKKLFETKKALSKQRVETRLLERQGYLTLKLFCLKHPIYNTSI